MRIRKTICYFSYRMVYEIFQKQMDFINYKEKIKMINDD